MLGKLNNTQIENLLMLNIMGHLGYTNNNNVYVIPISYAYDGEHIYCHSREGKKVEIMRKNPKICFQVEKIENMGNWESVIIQGEFEELVEETVLHVASEHLANRNFPLISSETVHLSAEWPFHSNSYEKIDGVFFRINIHKKVGRFEKSDCDDFYFAT